MDIFSLPEGNRKTLASQLRKSASGNFGPGDQVKLMSFGCRYSEAMIRIRHTLRAALRKSRRSPVSVGSRIFLWFSCIQESCSVYFCCF